MPRTVPDRVLEQILGKSRMPKSEDNKRGTKQKKTALKAGRKDPGQRNPRGGRYLEESALEQIQAQPGQMPQPGSTSRGRDAYNERALRGRDLGTFPRKGMGGVIQDVIKQVDGKTPGKFLSMPIAQAGEIMGIPTKGMEAYNSLDDKKKMEFWRLYGKDSNNPKKVLDTVVTKVVGDPDYKLETEEEPGSLEAEMDEDEDD